jgi:tRNA-splicing ligase RtcB
MPTQPVPGLLSWASDVEQATLEQAARAARLPFVDGHVALMPDAHVGIGATVGSVIPTRGAVIPAAVGVDIGCVDAMTEYLSPSGWKRVDQYDGGPVMQYHPETGTGQFVWPSRYIVLPCSEFLHFRSKYGVDQMLSPEHRVLFWKIVGRDRRREMHVVSAAEFAAEHERLAQGMRGEFETTFSPQLDTKLLLSDEELRVQVMFMADGHLLKGSSRGRAKLSLRKPRKIERARGLLTDAAIPFTENRGRDRTVIHFVAPMETKTYGDLWAASPEQLTIVADECLNWDGNRKDHVFFTRDLESADFIHYAFTATGKRAVLRADEHHSGRTDYRVFGHANTRVGIAGVPKTPVETVPSPDGKKYCFTVPSGFWVMRRGGNIAMTGNCGMIATETTLTAGDLPDSLAPLMPLVESRIPAGVGQGFDRGDASGSSLWQLGAAPADLTSKQLATAVNQFGTLGSGNHFVEVCLDERDRVWTVLHSGSRGIGNQLARRHISEAKKLMKQYFIGLEDPDLAYLVQGTPEFSAYIREMLWAQRYAMSSRAEMNAQLVRSLFEVAGHGETARTINCHHNFTQQEDHHGKPLWVTRKGAIKADRGDLGVIPGSMGTRSYIVAGRGNPASYHSCSHGAGRRMSRTAARAALGAESLKEAMGTRTWNADRAEALVDEHPAAYKDIDQVMADQTDLVEVLHTLSQVFNYKG